MPEWKIFLAHTLTVFNVLLAFYFVAGNGVYTLLMLMSLVSVWLHNRRLAYEGLDLLSESTVTPPVTIVMPAWNEQDAIVDSVRSVLKTQYPRLEVIAVDDGSTDSTLERLIAAFDLVRVDFIYRPLLPTKPVRAFYLSHQVPRLCVVSKERGGKPDALNVGINLCRTPYFCTLDADCVLERNALLRLMRPIIRSRVNTVASGGIVRILNGCTVEDGQVVRVGLPSNAIERFQVVEYLRTFLFGRTGWVLFDKNDPARVLARADKPLFEPEKPWEKVGQVPSVVFVEGLVREGPQWLFYYGGADKYVGVAVAQQAVSPPITSSEKRQGQHLVRPLTPGPMSSSQDVLETRSSSENRNSNPDSIKRLGRLPDERLQGRCSRPCRCGAREQ